MRAPIATGLLVLALASAAHAETTVGPASFVFAKPGTTTRAQAVKLAGTPTEEYDAEVLQGEIEPDVVRRNVKRHLDLMTRSAQTKRPIEIVRVLHWRDDVDTALFATLVFRDGTLAWAILPVSESESSEQKLRDRYGDIPAPVKERYVTGDLRRERTTWAFPDRGITYIQQGTDGRIEHKLVYPKR